MTRTNTVGALAGCFLLAACSGNQTSRDEAALTAACIADGEDEAMCRCIASGLRKQLDAESFSALTEVLLARSKAQTDEAKGAIMMGAISNPKVVLAFEKSDAISKECRKPTASGNGAAPAAEGKKLAGVYLPQLGDVDAGSRRLAASAADRRWEFSEDGTVVTYSQRGPVKWSYTVQGNEIRLRGADSKSQGESRRFTHTKDGRCIWDGSGRSSVDMRFCPE